MNRNFTFKRKKSHKLLFSIIAILIIIGLSMLAYSSYAETEEEEYIQFENVGKKLSCDIVYSVPESELKLEFGDAKDAPKAYGIIRRCESPEIVCYFVAGSSGSLFCQFKRLDTVRVKGTLKPQ